MRAPRATNQGIGHEAHPRLRRTSAGRQSRHGADAAGRGLGDHPNHRAAEPQPATPVRQYQHRVARRQRGRRGKAGHHTAGAAAQDHAGRQVHMERHARHVVARAGGSGTGCGSARCSRSDQAGGGASAQLPAGNRAAGSVFAAPARTGLRALDHGQRRLERTHPAGAADAERAARPRHGHGGVQRPARAGDRHSSREPHADRARPHLRRIRHTACPPLHGCAGRHHRRRRPIPAIAWPGSAPRRRRLREPADHHRLWRSGAPGRHRSRRAPITGGSTHHDGPRQTGHRPVRAARLGDGFAAGGRQSQCLSRSQATDTAGRRGTEPLLGGMGLHPRRVGADRQQRPRRLGAGDRRAGGIPALHAGVLGDHGHSHHVHGRAAGFLLAGRHDQCHQPDWLRHGARHRRRRRHRGRRGIAHPIQCRQVAGRCGIRRRDAHVRARGGVFAHHAVCLLAFDDP